MKYCVSRGSSYGMDAPRDLESPANVPPCVFENLAMCTIVVSVLTKPRR